MKQPNFPSDGPREQIMVSKEERGLLELSEVHQGPTYIPPIKQSVLEGYLIPDDLPDEQINDYIRGLK